MLRDAQDALFAGDKVILSSGESHGHQELSPVNKGERERRGPRRVPPLHVLGFERHKKQ